ncbi:MAG: PEP-CTERM sorting domain-containing protein [Planctomycetota bacterium]
MKKLLILTLVLGIASLATAVPTITVSNANPIAGETIQVYISGTAAEASTSGGFIGGYSGFVMIDYATYGPMGGSPYLELVYSAPAVTTAAGSYGFATAASYGYFFAAHLPPWSEAKDVDVGLWFTFDVLVISPTGYYSEVIDLLNPVPSNIGQVTITIIPEPITMALLGLGGLFLRKR